jgi:hypothetical protein
MTGDLQLIDANVLVHAYTVSDEKKHRLALPLVGKDLGGRGRCDNPTESL